MVKKKIKKKKNTKALFTSNTDDWATPKVIYDYFTELGYADPCPFQSNWDIKDTIHNFYFQKLFINPPFSKNAYFVDTVCNLIDLQVIEEVVFLIPARTDTRYFHKLLEYGFKVHFIKGRLKFNDTKGCATFPNIFMSHGNVSHDHCINMLNQLNKEVVK